MTTSDTPSTPGVPSEVNQALLYSVIEELVRELSAYRKEALLYPADHPRLQGRIQSISEILDAHLDRCGALELQVQEDGLSSGGKTIGQDSSAASLISVMFRERHIDKVSIESGVTIDEIRGFVQLLLLPPDQAVDPANASERDEWPHLHLHQSDSGFDTELLSDAEAVVLQNATENARVSLVADERLPSILAPRLGEERVAGFMRFLESDEIAPRLETLQERFKGFDGEIDFVHRFLEVLTRDPSMDWKDVGAMRSCIFAGIALLEEAAQKKTELDALPTQLLIPQKGSSDQLTTHFRWQLLRNFFPGEVAGRSPRAAEDLSFESSNHPGDAIDPLDVVSQEGWGEVEPELLRVPFREQFLAPGLLSEYSGVVQQLVTLSTDPAETKALQQVYFNNVRRHVEASAHPTIAVRAVVNETHQFPIERAGPLVTQLVRLVAPAECIDILDGGEPGVRETLLRSPPQPLDQPVTGEWGSHQRPRELLRQVLVPRDVFALNVCLRMLLGKSSQDAMGSGWLELFEALIHDNPIFSTWMHANAEFLFRPEALPILFRIPYAELRLELMRHFAHQDDSRLERFFAGLGHYTAEISTRLLTLGLEFESPTVRNVVIQALGSQTDPRALQALVNLLEQSSEMPVDDEETEAVCQAIARSGGQPAREVLNQVLKERSGLRHRWRRSTRKAATAALKSLFDDEDAP